MRELGLSVAVLFAAASFGWAQGASQAARPTTHKVDAEVVSTDVEKKTITVNVAGAEKTALVGPLAMLRLKKLKAGDKVILTCKDDPATGAHKEVSFIRMAADPAKAAPAPAAKRQ
jgi:hypothetical protein